MNDTQKPVLEERETIYVFYINSLYGTDGRPMIPKKTSVTGSHERPVRLYE
jgi:hypothetical protein